MMCRLIKSIHFYTMNQIILNRATLAMFIALICIISLNVNVYSSKSAHQDIEIIHTWSGDYPTDQLELLPAVQNGRAVDFIDDAQTFAAVWKIFKPDTELPDIDFEHHLVLFTRNTQFYNSIRIGRVVIYDGVAEIIAMETMSAMPIEDKVGMSIAVVPRNGIIGIKDGDKIIEIPDN